MADASIKNTRLLSLDVFRGLTIAAMILVNTPGDWGVLYDPQNSFWAAIFKVLRHSDWHGWTPTDLIFPFFLFISGTALAYSMRGGAVDKSRYLKTLKRIAIIFGIGWILSNFPFFHKDPENFRTMGVLQRIALAWGIASLLIFKFKTRGLLVISAITLLAYWGFSYGFWAFYHWGNGEPYELATSINRALDIKVLGGTHLWNQADVWDPEGLFSTIPAIFTAVMGYFAGKIILERKDDIQAIQKLLIFGASALVLGLIWGQAFPINKNLWTSTYVLVTGGVAYLVLAGLFALIDFKKQKKWTYPFQVFGSNALLLYIFAQITVLIEYFFIKIDVDGKGMDGYTYLYTQVFAPAFGREAGCFFFAIAHIAVLWCIMLILHRRKIFFKV